MDELTRLGVESAFLPVDVEPEASCHALVAATVERFGGLDILVNNAGTAIARRPEALTIEEWKRVIDTNLTGAFTCAQAAYPEMKKVAGGKIINVASGLAFRATPNGVAYCSSKGGLVQMGRVLENLRLGAPIPARLPSLIAASSAASISRHASATRGATTAKLAADRTGKVAPTGRRSHLRA